MGLHPIPFGFGRRAAVRAHRLRVHRGAVSLLLALCFAPLQAATPLEVRDAETGAFLSARMQRQEEDVAATQLLRGRAPVQTDGAVWEVGAPQHHPVQIELTPEVTAWQVWLAPRRPRPYPEAHPDEAVFEGFVHNRRRAAPVAGAKVRLDTVEAITDEEGRFVLRLPRSPAGAEAGRQASLRVRHAEGVAQRMLRIVPGAHRLIVDLDAGDAGPDHRLDADVVQQLQADPAPEAAVAARAPVLAPPATLRIGYADAGFSTPCCTGSCSSVAVMPLETYVRRGLNDEWIASWRPDALRAGAIAYRSYGAWHAANPRTATYDLCSSACCQVNDPDTSASTDAAVTATLGLMLERQGTVFRSEYSAENNAWDDPDDGLSCSNADLSCGDGFVGSPATGWPCLADTVALGRGCFGHGRGMSQWGSQRWADLQARRWPWIVEHYYSASGTGSGLRTAVISSPLAIDAVSALPVSAEPGARLTLRYAVTQLAGETHPDVLLGASLYRVGVGYISDPANDASVSLAPGSDEVERDFILPSAVDTGSYDLLTALYLDVDGNGAINSGDFPLVTRSFPAAVTVIAAAQALFADGFE